MLWNIEVTFHCEWYSLLAPYTGAEPEVNVVARPLPECFMGKCSCPRGYSYDYNQHACLSSNTEGYNYSIQGGGQEQTGNTIKAIWSDLQAYFKDAKLQILYIHMDIFLIFSLLCILYTLYELPALHALWIAGHFMHL